MLTFLISVIVFIILGLVTGIFKSSKYVDKYDDLKAIQVAKAAGVLTLSIAIGCLQPTSVQRIDAGNIGLKIDRVGNEKGIPVAIPVKGWVFYNSWTSDIIEYSIRQNHVQYPAFRVTTKGGFAITVAPSFNYSLIPEKATAVYINLLKGGDFASLETTWLLTATNIALNNASNNYTIDSIFNNKQHYQNDVTAELNRELRSYFVVSQINPGVTPPAELQAVIVAKTNSIQQTQQAELARIKAVAEADTKIATARGDSASLIIAEQANAEAIRIKQRELSPLYIEYVKWSKWDGALPTTSLGNNQSVLLQK